MYIYTPSSQTRFSYKHFQFFPRNQANNSLKPQSIFTKMTFILVLIFSLFLQGTLGEIICEELPIGMCSFSIASSGKRCLFETYTSDDGIPEFQCMTSEVFVKNMPEWIESDECTSACGVDRYTVGISSDALLEPRFTAKLCSLACYQDCPNIVDLYHNLALAEGVFLRELCKAQRINPRRAMAELQSSGEASVPASATAAGPAPVEAAAGPVSSDLSAPVASSPASV